MKKNMLLLLLLLIFVSGYGFSQEKEPVVSKGRIVAGALVGFTIGFGIGNFIIGDVGGGVGFLFFDLIAIGGMSPFFLSKIYEKSYLQSTGKFFGSISIGIFRKTMLVIGIIGAVLLGISRLSQLFTVLSRSAKYNQKLTLMKERQGLNLAQRTLNKISKVEFDIDPVKLPDKTVGLSFGLGYKFSF